MRNVWRGLLCTAIMAGFTVSAAAATGVRVWVPTPVKEKPHKAAAAKTKVVTVVMIRGGYSRYPRLTSRDWWLDGSRSGYTKVYSGPLYPF